MNDDMALVREYAGRNSEEAFATLVRRHINMVYSAALRRTGNVHLAEEITQVVFIILARKAGSLGPNTLLSGWLCRTARYACADALKSEQRRLRRETQALARSMLNPSEPDVWSHIAPLLEDAMAELDTKDHDAIVQRFFEGKSMHDVGLGLGTNEVSARKRVSRAVEKMRVYFARRGIAVSAQAITGAVAVKSVQAAPGGLAAAVTSSAVQTAGPTASTLRILRGTLKLMTLSKIKMAALTAAVVLLGVGTACIVIPPVKKRLSGFPGYATPEAAVLSAFWATSHADLEETMRGVTGKSLASMEPWYQEWLRSRQNNVSEAEFRRKYQFYPTKYVPPQIVDKTIVSDTEVRVHVHPPAPAVDSIMVMRKVGDEWKRSDIDMAPVASPTDAR